MEDSSYSVDRRGLDPEIKIPEISFPDVTDKINFYTESCKLAQANMVLSAAVKELLLYKYSLQERVQNLSEYIRKIENQSKYNKLSLR